MSILCVEYSHTAVLKRCPKLVIEGLKIWNIEVMTHGDWHTTEKRNYNSKENGKIGDIKAKDLKLGASTLAMAHSLGNSRRCNESKRASAFFRK